jgi:hypothetical protein
MEAMERRDNLRPSEFGDMAGVDEVRIFIPHNYRDAPPENAVVHNGVLGQWIGR